MAFHSSGWSFVQFLTPPFVLQVPIKEKTQVPGVLYI
jgi:hypothetical protein